MKHVLSFGTGRNVWYGMLDMLPVALAFVLLVSISASLSPRSAALAAPNLSTISGTVTRAGVAVDDAQVVMARSTVSRSA